MKIQTKRLSHVTISDIFWFLIFWMIALPLHASNNLLTYVSLTGKISWFQIFIGIIFLYRTIRSLKFRITKQAVFNLLFAISLVVTIAIGFLDKTHVKGGFFLGVFYFAPLFAVIVRLLSAWRKTRAKSYIMIAAIYAMLLLATTVLTSQIIHTYAPNVFAWAFAGCILNKGFNARQEQLACI